MGLALDPLKRELKPLPMLLMSIGRGTEPRWTYTVSSHWHF